MRSRPLLFYGGAIVPMTGPDKRVQALVVRDRQIVFTGSLSQARALAGPGVQTVDLGNKALLPAFIDAHSHLTMTAQYRKAADLSACTDISQITAALNGFLRDHPTGPEGAVLGVNYDHNFLKEGLHPDREALDAVSREIPIFLFHSSSHMGVANSALLRAIGVSESTPDPQGGRLGRRADGSLSGYLEESPAFLPALAEVFQRLHLDLPALIEEAQDVYLRSGITTVQEGACSPENAKLLASLGQAGKLKVDVVCYMTADAPEDPEQTFRDLAPHVRRYQGRVKLGGYKIFLDGSPQGRTAWLTRPYAGTDLRGYPQHTDEDVYRLCARALSSHRQLLAHCNGDAACGQFLRQYRRAWEDSGHRTALRPVMIHCQTVRRDQLEQMARIGMIPSFFVDHIWFWGDVHRKNLGPDRAGQISPAADALNLGLPMTFHQDTPVVPPDMLRSIWCAVNRTTRGGSTLGPDQAVSVYEALKAVTRSAAFSYFEEDRKGTLEPGKLADLVILDRDPLSCPAGQLRDIRVEATYKEGRCLYRRPKS